MTGIVWGILGTVLALLLFAAGAWCGAEFSRRYREKTAAKVTEELSEQEKRRYREDAQAFDTLVNYSADIAYGMYKPSDMRADRRLDEN